MDTQWTTVIKPKASLLSVDFGNTATFTACLSSATLSLGTSRPFSGRCGSSSNPS